MFKQNYSVDYLLGPRHSPTPCWWNSSLPCIPLPTTVCAWHSRGTALVTYLLSPCRQEFEPAMYRGACDWLRGASTAGRHATMAFSLFTSAGRLLTQTSEHRIRSDHYKLKNQYSSTVDNSRFIHLQLHSPTYRTYSPTNRNSIKYDKVKL